MDFRSSVVSVVFYLVKGKVEFFFWVCDVLSKCGFILFGFCCVFASLSKVVSVVAD